MPPMATAMNRPITAMPSTASEVVAAFRRGELAPSAALGACLARIERHNPKVNALVTLDTAHARTLAAECDRQLEHYGFPEAQPLFGLPVTIKDAFATAGLRTTSSHPPLKDFVPDTDATVVARLKAAGAIVLGKSNLPELAGDPQCWSPLFGPTHNPWNPTLTPGGSSGGSAAAVAMGFSLLELGSDIAGSIRIPAAYCGVAGLKATENLIPRTGHIPHLPGRPRSVRHLLSFGLLGRSVADLQLGLPVIAGPDGIDHEVRPVPKNLPATEPRQLRIAWWDSFGSLPLCARTRAGLDNALGLLAQHGHRITRAWPSDLEIDSAWRCFGTLLGAETGLDRPWLQRQLMHWGSHLLPRRQILGIALAAGSAARFSDYNAALDRRDGFISALEGFLEDHDVLVCPVACCAAYPAFRPHPFRPPPALLVDGQRAPWIEGSVGMTALFSLTGSPVVSLPVGVIDGLPVGLQVVGRRWQESRLLAAARRIESELGGIPAPPLLADG